MNHMWFIAYHILLDDTNPRWSSAHPEGDPQRRYDSNTDYYRLITSRRNWGIQHINSVALPGCPWQNAHWDWRNDERRRPVVTIDVPLLDVEEAAGPIQLWPGTHTLNYAKGFVHPNDARVCPLPPTEGSERRQYWHCYREMNELTRRLPSKLVVSQAGDIVIRRPETFHRGTPNQMNIPRDMLDFQLWHV